MTPRTLNRVDLYAQQAEAALNLARLEIEDAKKNPDLSVEELEQLDAAEKELLNAISKSTVATVAYENALWMKEEREKAQAGK